MPRPGYGRERGRKTGGFVVPVEDEDPIPLDPTNFNGGVRFDAPAVQIPLRAATEILDVRFEDKGIRKDFGYESVGQGSASTILALGEHKFIDNDEEFHRLVRVQRNSDDNAELEVWDGSSWILVDTTSETIRNVMLSMISTQNLLLLADGEQIIKWGEVPQVNEIENDFPSGDTLESVGNSSSVTIPSANAHDNDYTVHYSVDISGTTTQPKELVLRFLFGGEEVDEKTYVAEASDASKSWPHEDETFFIPDFEDGEEVTIEVVSFTADEDQTEAFSEVSGDPSWEAIKSIVAEASGDEYIYVYDVTIEATPNIGSTDSSVTVGYWKDSGSGWELFDTDEWINPSDSRVTQRVEAGKIVDGMGDGDKFGLSVEGTSGLGGSIVAIRVDYSAGPSFSVKPFNLATDGDPHAGVTHDERTGTVSTFEAITDAPAATYIMAFGDRVLAVQDTGDPQRLSWSADGNIEDWTGLDSGSTSLLDARSDPMDDLMALGSVASNAAVLFRKRSLMRVFETGNPELAIGVEHWIEGIGTESPHSVAQVRDGVMFLGHDYTVYYFNGSADPQPVGMPIQRDLLDRLSEENIHRVDSTYDPVFGEYWMRVPGRTWIFNVANFLEEQELQWRARSVSPQRLATVSRL